MRLVTRSLQNSTPTVSDSIALPYRALDDLEVVLRSWNDSDAAVERVEPLHARRSPLANAEAILVEFADNFLWPRAPVRLMSWSTLAGSPCGRGSSEPSGLNNHTGMAANRA